MADATGRFRGKLEDVCALGRRNRMRLTKGQIKDVLRDEDLTDSQLQLVYTYLDQMSISVVDEETEEGSGHDPVRRRSLEVYLEELDRIAMLPEEVEFRLFEKAAEGDKEAADALTERYLQTVCDLAAEYESRHPGLDAEDLVQEANTGLVLGIRALKKEETLAACRAQLLNSVTAYLEESVHDLEEMMNSDHRIVKSMNRLAESVRVLTEQLSRKPSVDELSAFLDLPAEDIRDLLRVGGESLEVSDR